MGLAAGRRRHRDAPLTVVVDHAVVVVPKDISGKETFLKNVSLMMHGIHFDFLSLIAEKIYYIKCVLTKGILAYINGSFYRMRLTTLSPKINFNYT